MNYIFAANCWEENKYFYNYAILIFCCRVLPYSTVDLSICLGRVVPVYVYAAINKDRLQVSQMAKNKQT